MSIEAMKMAWWALCLTNNEAVPDDIEERREAAIEALRQALAQTEEEWDSRHPKAQALLRERARLQIELGLVEQLVDDPHFETTPTFDMEYWGPLHDKLKEALTQEEKPPVKSYAGGKPNYCTPVDTVNTSQERVDETAKGEHEPFIYIREDTEMPFGGYEHCGEHDPGALPVYLAPPKRDSLSWVDCTDEQLMEEVRRRGFVIRDAQVGAKWVGLTGLEQKELMAMNSRYAVFETEARLKEKNG
jgi:hypothetical protein